MVNVVLDRAGNAIVKRPEGSLVCQVVNFDKSLCQQNFTDMTDINKIMKKWLNGSGPNPHNFDFANWRFGDVSIEMDYREMIDRTMAIEEGFEALPAEVRARFHNDPGMLLDFVADPTNHKECLELGLIKDGVLPTLSEPTLQPTEGSAQGSLDVTVRTDSQ